MSAGTATVLPQSLTPLPTVEDPISYIYELYEHNGGCTFPCWWAINPGVSTLTELQQFTEQLTDAYVSLEGPFEFPDQPNTERYVLFYPPLAGSVDYSRTTQFHVVKGIIMLVEIDPEASPSLRLGLKDLIEQYGIPSYMYVGSESMIIEYRDERIMAGYKMYESNGSGDLRPCLFPKVGPFGWALGYEFGLEDIQNRLDNGELISVDSIDEWPAGEFVSALELSEDGYCLP
jgi:hypothetical protein